MKTLSVSSLVLCGLVSGCLVERNYLDPDLDLDFDNGVAVDVDQGGQGPTIQGAQLRGDIGPVVEFDGPATGSLVEDLGTTYIQLDSRGTNGTGFMLLVLDKSIRDLPLGETYMSGTYLEDASYVQLCSANNEDSYDAIAEEVVMVVVERGDARDISIEAIAAAGFYDSTDPSGQTLTSSNFTVLNGVRH